MKLTGRLLRAWLVLFMVLALIPAGLMPEVRAADGALPAAGTVKAANQSTSFVGGTSPDTADSSSLIAAAALILGAASVVALVIQKKAF